MSDPTAVAHALADAARTISAPRSLDDTLDAIVHAARTSIPGFDHVGISVLHGNNKVETRAGTGQVVWECDAIQYSLGEGPCIGSLRQAPVVVAPHLSHDQRWPRYVPQAVGKGVRAQMAYRLYVEDDTLGGLNFYSTVSDTVPDGAGEIGELFAIHATLALGRALEEENLNSALTTRGLIGQAVGLTMARFQVTSERAFQFMVRASSTSNIKLRDIAQEIVDEANTRFGGGSPG